MGRKSVINSLRQRTNISNTARNTKYASTNEHSEKIKYGGCSSEEDEEAIENQKPSWLATTVIMLLSTVLYLNSLDCGFVFDDMSAIDSNKDLRSSTPVSQLFWNDFWGTPMRNERSHKSYRPLTVLTFRWNYALGEKSPWGYHLANVILHGVVSVMFYLYCLRLNCGHRASVLASILFAVHPIHTEAVTGVVGRAELLASIFFLAALMVYQHCSHLKSMKIFDWFKLLFVVVLVALGTLCKEQGITVIGVCCVYEVFIVQKLTIDKVFQRYWLFSSKNKNKSDEDKELTITFSRVWLGFRRCILLIGATVFLLYIRIQVMGAQLPIFTAFDNPAAHSPFPQRQLTYNYLLPVNLGLLIFPYHLCCDWTMGTLPVIDGWLDRRNIFTVLFWVGLFTLTHYAIRGTTKLSRVTAVSLSILGLPFLPASNLFFPVGFVVAERVLYTPSMGFCLLASLLLDQLLKKNYLRNILGVIVFIIILLFSVKTWTRNYDWKSEYTLFTSALKVNVRNAKLWNNVGHALESEAKWKEALSYFQKAAKVQPDDIGAHINVGRTFVNMNMTLEAEQAYKTALDLLPKPKKGEPYTSRIAPQHLKVFINLSNLLVRGGNKTRLEEADNYLRRAISMRADFVEAYQNRADILIRLNRRKEAIEHYEKALEYDPSNPDLYFNLGVVRLTDKQKQEALDYFQKALEYDPNHKQALYNSAVILSESADRSHKMMASERFQTLSKLGYDQGSVEFSMGMLATDTKRFEDAEVHYLKALEKEPTMRAGLFNMALLYNTELGKPKEAADMLGRLLEAHPDHAKGHLLMGDIMLNNAKRNDLAGKYFQNAINLEPKNAQAHHNLCVVLVETGRLIDAEKCLVTALSFAKRGEEYIANSLQVVRSKIKEVERMKNVEVKAKTEEKVEKKTVKGGG